VLPVRGDQPRMLFKFGGRAFHNEPAVCLTLHGR
jgi:hypothetical protein